MFDRHHVTLNGLDLSAKLVLPVQLQPRVIQLLKDFQKLAGPTEDELTELENALKFLELVDETRNNVALMTDTRRKQFQIESLIYPEIKVKSSNSSSFVYLILTRRDWEHCRLLMRSADTSLRDS